MQPQSALTFPQLLWHHHHEQNGVLQFLLRDGKDEILVELSVSTIQAPSKLNQAYDRIVVLNDFRLEKGASVLHAHIGFARALLKCCLVIITLG